MRKTTRLVWLVVPIAALLLLGGPLLTSAMNQVRVLGYPLGFFMEAQGTVLLLAALGFWFCRRQDKLERGAERDEA